MTEILPFLIGGLVLFVYAISQLSLVMENAFSDKAKQTIEKYTKNIFSAILIGTITTVLLGSSSAVVILTIVFINAKTLNFKQAIGIIMGANIGTTFSSQIIALDIGQYAVIPLFIGVVFEIFSKNERYKKWGKISLYLGMLFFGLYLIQESVHPLKESTVFESWITQISDNPIQGALSGGLITLIIQSSSATVGLAIVLGKQQLITIPAGIAVMLGAELGTCSDTLLATVNGSRQALKAGLFHFIFNLSTIIIGLILFYPFVQFVELISSNQGIDNYIANAHMLFNIIGVLAFIPFISFFEHLLNYLLPDKEETTS